MPVCPKDVHIGGKPRFAVVVPAYNAERTLDETLDSIGSQEFSDWECVVVDDGSSDSTPAIVESRAACDGRIRLIRQDNTGTAGAYRTAIEGATSDLIVICAADDLLLPTHLLEMDRLIRHNPDYEIYSCNGEYLYDDSRDRRPVYWRPEWQKQRSLSFHEVIAECFYSVGVVIRRETYELADGHRRGVYTDDYDLWLRAMARGGRHLYTPLILSVHRVSDFQQSANLRRLYESNIEVYSHLLATEPLDSGTRLAIERAQSANQECIDNLSVDALMDSQARRLRQAYARLFGQRNVDTVMRITHAVSWMVRPLRRVVARLQTWRSSG